MERRAFLLAAAALSASATLPAAASEAVIPPPAGLQPGALMGIAISTGVSWGEAAADALRRGEPIIRRTPRKVVAVAGEGCEVALDDEMLRVVRVEFDAGWIEHFHFERAGTGLHSLVGVEPADPAGFRVLLAPGALVIREATQG